MTLPAELAVMLGRLERELRQGSVSEESQQWLAQCGLTAEQMAAQLEAEYIPERKLHLYHCDHRGLPQALISPEGKRRGAGSMTSGKPAGRGKHAAPSTVTPSAGAAVR